MSKISFSVTSQPPNMDEFFTYKNLRAKHDQFVVGTSPNNSNPQPHQQTELKGPLVTGEILAGLVVLVALGSIALAKRDRSNRYPSNTSQQ